MFRNQLKYGDLLFGGTNIELPDDLDQSDLEETNFSEWNMIKDDSTLVEMLDSIDLENLDSTVESQEYSIEED